MISWKVEIFLLVDKLKSWKIDNLWQVGKFKSWKNDKLWQVGKLENWQVVTSRQVKIDQPGLWLRGAFRTRCRRAACSRSVKKEEISIKILMAAMTMVITLTGPVMIMTRLMMNYGYWRQTHREQHNLWVGVDIMTRVKRRGKHRTKLKENSQIIF